MELLLFILVCIRKSYIDYLEIYVVPIGHGFSFLVMEKSWKINVEKEGAPCLLNGTVYTADADLTSDPILCTTAER